MFRNSRFYISVLIISTYLLFVTIPYCVFTFLSSEGGLLANKTSTLEYHIAEILINLTYTSDAVIYIFLQGDVRNTLLEMVYCCGVNQGENLHQSRFNAQAQIEDNKRSTDV